MDDLIDPSRRRFLQLGLVGAVSLAAARPALAFSGGVKGLREIAFYNLHTDEKLRTTYWKDGGFDSSSMDRINHILRDFRTGDVYPISANLIELLHDLSRRLGTDAPFEIISGYRSPRTNAMLSAASGGVAKKSLHTRGLAVDIRVAGVSLRKLQRTAIAMQRGGVGYYEKSNFVHVDVGRVRRWG